MSRFDQDREELIRLIFSICDYARLGYDISTYDNCNNCKVSDCEYKPKLGGAVRWNCPLHNADRKTENCSEKPNNCERITEDGVTCAKYPACDDCPDNPLNKVKGSERLLKGKDEPQTEAWQEPFETMVERG